MAQGEYNAKVTEVVFGDECVFGGVGVLRRGAC
jgi:hypothetical protein